MQPYYLIGVVVLVIILIAKIIGDMQLRWFINEHWPKWLSKKTKIELWELYNNDGDIENCRVRNKTMYLIDYGDFFLEGYRIPRDCGVSNPVVIVDDFDLPFGSEKVMSKNTFELRYKAYKSFNSLREYIKYVRS